MSIGRALTGWAGYAAVALVGAVLAWTAQGWRADARLAKVEKDWGESGPCPASCWLRPRMRRALSPSAATKQ